MNNLQKRAYFIKLAKVVKAAKRISLVRDLYKQAGGRILPGIPMPAPNEPKKMHSILEREEDNRVVMPPPSMSGDPNYFGDKEVRPSPRPYSYTDDSENDSSWRPARRNTGYPDSNIIVPYNVDIVPNPAQKHNPNIILPPGFAPRPLPYNYDGRPLGPNPAELYNEPYNPNTVVLPGVTRVAPNKTSRPPIVRPLKESFAPRPLDYDGK